MRWILTGGVVGLTAVVIGLAVWLASPRAEAERPYPQDSPQAVLESAWRMVEQDRADRLPELIRAESPEMRSVLNRLGRLLGDVQTLAAELQKRFPEEVEQRRAELRRAAASGEGGSLGDLLRGGGDREGGPPDGLLAALLADPYGRLERNRDRISAQRIADDTAAVMVDGEPALGVGLTMREQDGRWKIDLPTNLPILSRYMPRNREEYAIVASMVQVIDNAVLDLTEDVRRGRCEDLEDAARRAGQKAWIPMMMCYVAYQRAMEAREG